MSLQPLIDSTFYGRDEWRRWWVATRIFAFGLQPIR